MFKNLLNILKTHKGVEALIVMFAFIGSIYGGVKMGANVDHSTTNIHGGHTLVVPGDSLGGFMSGADKTKLDGLGLTMIGTADAFSTANIASLSGLAATVDGVALNTDSMEVCTASQTTTTQDGCYLVHSGAWTRAPELAAGSSATKRYIVVPTGTSNKGIWVFGSGTQTVGTSDLTASNIVTAGGSSFPPTGDLAMGGHGLTGERAGTTTGEPVTYEQVSQSVLRQTDGAFKVVRLEDDFQGAQAATTGAATVPIGVTFGTQGWRNSSTTGSLAIVTTAQDSNHFGIVDLLTPAGAGNAMGSQSVGAVTFGSGQTLVQEWNVQEPTLCDGTNTCSVRVGYVDSAVTPTNGIYVEHVVASSANWRCVAMSASTPTLASGGTATPVTGGAWHRAAVTWDGTTWGCKIDGVSIGTGTTGMPTVAVPRGFGITWVAGAARHLYVDLFQETEVWNTSRG